MTRRAAKRPAQLRPSDARPYKQAADRPDLISRAATSLSRESLVSKGVTFLLRSTGKTYDDHTGPLRQSPLGMFFYNQRTLFLLFSGLFLLLLTPLSLGDAESIKTLLLLVTTWVRCDHGRIAQAVHAPAFALARFRNNIVFSPYFLSVFYSRLIVSSCTHRRSLLTAP